MDVIALVGPPGSGKSTVSAHLRSTEPGLHIFRLRERARAQAVTDHQLAQELTQTPDPLGWLSDATATLLVRRALKTLDAAAVLLEGYPGNEVQARALAHDSARERWRLTAIELDASETVCTSRVQRRRVCPVCDPHRRRPATSTPQGRCRTCAGTLERRRSDCATSVSLRQIRYRANAAGLRAALRSAGVAWHTVDAEQDTGSVIAAARAALAFHTTTGR
ncbi:nucleoside monophosphate kinase [Streptomyces alboflavus]|uniref:nucleoside monophosphate kinase n=1 Tax=Streptomyces alboflavus TaxID=67267 RepID=UPI000F657038|nr:nucleoside monophosphate kinase [Streptomyces alboflavus]